MPGYVLLSERQGASDLLIEYAQSAMLFNPEPQETVSAHAVACGSGLNDSMNNSRLTFSKSSAIGLTPGG